MREPTWPKVHHPPIACQNILYYSAPKQKGPGPKSLDEVDPKLLEPYSKLGISLREQERVAADAVFDSVSAATTHARNFSQCDPLLIGNRCGAHTFPHIEVKNSSSRVEHEASTSKIGDDQIFYCNQRGISTQDAVNMIVNGFCKDVFQKLPMEFAVEAQKHPSVSLEGSVG
jgi:Fe-S cluster assembly scaffold protein SufB